MSQTLANFGIGALANDIRLAELEKLRKHEFLSRGSLPASDKETVPSSYATPKAISGITMSALWDRIGAARTIRAVLVLLDKPYGGSVVASALGLVALTLLIAGFGFGLDWVRTWKVIGFPGALPPFFDLHIITDNAARCADAAVSEYPYVHARCDPWHQLYNYPPVWLMLGKLGINGDHTVLLATMIELPALALFAYLLRGRSIRCALIALPLMLSPSVVLGFERGNIDILEWALVCVAALVYCDGSKRRAAISLLLLCLAVVLKFLAIFCCTLAGRLRPASVIVAALLVVFSLLYLYSLSNVLPRIRTITTISPYVSYGYIILFDRLEFLYGPWLGFDLTGLTASWVRRPSSRLRCSPLRHGPSPFGAVAVRSTCWTKAALASLFCSAAAFTAAAFSCSALTTPIG